MNAYARRFESAIRAAARAVDRGLAAVDVVIASIREVARGVRTVGANTDSH